jgi:hypothetical protein
MYFHYGKLLAMSKLIHIIKLMPIARPIKNMGIFKNTVKQYLNLVQANQMTMESYCSISIATGTLLSVEE